MTRPAAKGWCPGAYHPMMSGDGLVVRIRPMFAELSAKQAFGLCDLAEHYGSGLIDLTSRANLQIRGVSERHHEPLLQALNALGLLPDDPDIESRRNVLITPFWQTGDLSQQLARTLFDRLADFPDLPAKFGFAIDTGEAPILRQASADIRFERLNDDRILLLADGADFGREVIAADAIDQALSLVEWFMATGGADRKRMARHLKDQALPGEWTTQAARPAEIPPAPGPSQRGMFYGAPFGQVQAQDLRALIKESGSRALRVTPWRLILTVDAAPVAHTGFITNPKDPVLTAHACSGTPLCQAASVTTRALAAKLAAKTSKSLHVSGCAKGCAHPRVSDVTLVGRDGRFDLVKHGRPWDDPDLTGLTGNDLLDRIGEF